MGADGTYIAMLGGACGAVFLALMKFVADALKNAREDVKETRAEAKAERDATRAEIVETLGEMATAQRAMAEAQEAQYVISDGLIRVFREASGLPAPERPPPGVAKRAPRREGGD